MTAVVIVQKSLYNSSIFPKVLEKLKNFHVEKKLGCEEHQDSLTKAVMMHFVTTQLIFACKRFEDRLSVIKAKKRKAKSILKKYRLNALQPTLGKWFICL